METITGVVLCGGAGTRFGGMDKPLALLGDRPLYQHVIERVQSQVELLVLSANRNLPQYRTSGLPVYADLADDLGPLGGVQAALEVIASPLLFVCPGDCPRLPRDLVTRLAECLTEETDVVVPHDGHRLQPLFMLLRRPSRTSLSHYLADGGRSVHGWLEKLNVVELTVEDPQGFMNINTSEDLFALERDRR
jgi:molybdopterin-guanine dinucleotide biosynthesis protein A